MSRVTYHLANGDLLSVEMDSPLKALDQGKMWLVINAANGTTAINTAHIVRVEVGP